MKRSVTRYCNQSAPRTVLTIGTLAVLIGACGGPDTGPEEQLRQWVNEGQAAVEAKRRSDLIDMISPAYVDARGYEREQISALFAAYFLRQHRIKLMPSIEKIRLYGETAAKIDLTVGMAGTNDGVFGFSADAYRFVLELEYDGSDWLLISARWGELGKGLN